MEIVKIDRTTAIEFKKTTGKVLSVNQEHVTEVSSHGGNSSAISSNTILVTRILLELANARQVSYTMKCNNLMVFENQIITVIEGRVYKKNTYLKPILMVNHSMGNYFIDFDPINMGYTAKVIIIPFVVSIISPFIIGVGDFIYHWILKGEDSVGSFFGGIMTGLEIFSTCLFFAACYFIYLPIKIKRLNKKVEGIYRRLANDTLNTHI